MCTWLTLPVQCWASCRWNPTRQEVWHSERSWVKLPRNLWSLCVAQRRWPFPMWRVTRRSLVHRPKAPKLCRILLPGRSESLVTEGCWSFCIIWPRKLTKTHPAVLGSATKRYFGTVITAKCAKKQWKVCHIHFLCAMLPERKKNFTSSDRHHGIYRYILHNLQKNKCNYLRHNYIYGPQKRYQIWICIVNNPQPWKTHMFFFGAWWSSAPWDLRPCWWIMWGTSPR